MNEFYNKKIEEVLELVKSRAEGLSNAEAEKRLLENGKNKLKEVKKQSNFSKFINEFNDLMIIILIIASFISFVIAIVRDESFVDSIIILAIVILNAILGFIQELKADQAVDALKNMQVKKVKVKRENNVILINSEDVVVGDILVLEAGDTICADARIIWAASLKTDESSLTGESLPVDKKTTTIKEEVSLSNRYNMIYSGTDVVYGKALAVVTSIGMNTEFGKIADALTNDEKELTPLQVKINEISKVLSIIIGVIILSMFVVGVIRDVKLTEVVMLSISLAVAAIPEGLPAVITIILSLGMSTMAKKKAIVRKMSSVETLGSTEIICSDKTGTITQNIMSVREVYYDNKIYNETDILEENILTDIMLLNNDIEVSPDMIIGDPTEIALYNYAGINLDIDSIRNNHKRIDELPFDSERKMMSTINEYPKKNKILTKGSFDSIIKCCDRVLENGKALKLTEERKIKLKEVEELESNKAYRVLAFAYKDIDEDTEINKNMENNLIFVGLACMMDPPREDVKEAIALCKSAHIKPIMITGDSLATAVAISREIGILEHDDEAITGIELDKLSEDELTEAVNKYSVYARVSPMNKLAIINAWKKNNKIVAMTGDGVNDAPALRTADIGVGMGITGTEVSKSVSDIILSDDSFSTIVTAVREGRRIYDNIKKVLAYLLTGNITEVLIVFIGMLFGIEVFLPIQLLYINLVTDSIPAIALAFEVEDPNVMNREVRKKDSSFFTPFLLSEIIFASIMKAVAILTIYFMGCNTYGIEIGKTMAFLSLIILEIVFAYSCRNLKKSIFTTNVVGNSYLNRCTLILVIFQIIVFVTPLRNIFNITILSINQFLHCFIICLGVFVIDELSKPILSKLFKD